MALTVFCTLVRRVWFAPASFQWAPQKIRSTCIWRRIGPPVSTMLREPVLLNRIDGTERSSRFSHLGRYEFAPRVREAGAPCRLVGRLLAYRFHMVVSPRKELSG